MLSDKAFIALTGQEILWLVFLVISCICVTLKRRRRYFPFHYTPIASPPRKTHADFLETRFIQSHTETTTIRKTSDSIKDSCLSRWKYSVRM